MTRPAISSKPQSWVGGNYLSASGAVGLVAASPPGEIPNWYWRKMASVSQWAFLVWPPNNPPGTDAMKKPITSFDCLKRLVENLEPQFIKHLLAVIWKVVAAVHCFFRPRDHARQHRHVRETSGATPSRTRSIDPATNHQASGIRQPRPNGRLVRIRRRALPTQSADVQLGRYAFRGDHFRAMVLPKHRAELTRHRAAGCAAGDRRGADDASAGGSHRKTRC